MTGQKFVEELPAALAGQRVDRVVSLLVDVSRSEAVSLIKNSHIKLSGTVVSKPSLRVVAGSEIEIYVPLVDTSLQPDPSISLSVVYEDEDVLVIDKQAHLVVHPGAGAPVVTLVHGLLAQYPEIAEVGEGYRPGIVHRLDKETSGLLMVARTIKAFESLTMQLRDRSVGRRYETVVKGNLASANGVIDAPIGRSSKDPTRQAIVAGGKAARTHYEVVTRFPSTDFTHLECKLETGRTHQIRVHLSSIQHPVLGDSKYGGPLTDGLDRFFLHARSLSFAHPSSGQEMSFESPLPVDLLGVLETL